MRKILTGIFHIVLEILSHFQNDLMKRMKKRGTIKPRKKKNKSKRLEISRRSGTEQILKEDVQRFLDMGLKAQVENAVGTEKEDENFFNWIDVLHNIGKGALTSAFLKMKILEREHVCREVYYEVKETDGRKVLFEGVSLVMCMSHEVLDQLARGVRRSDQRWPKPIQNLIHTAPDLAVIIYATNMGLGLPPDVIQRCQIGDRVTATEMVSGVFDHASDLLGEL